MLSEARKHELGYKCLKLKFKKDGLRVSDNLRREAGNIAKVLGISLDETLEFIEVLVHELVEEVFSSSNKKKIGF